MGSRPLPPNPVDLCQPATYGWPFSLGAGSTLARACSGRVWASGLSRTVYGSPARPCFDPAPRVPERPTGNAALTYWKARKTSTGRACPDRLARALIRRRRPKNAFWGRCRGKSTCCARPNPPARPLTEPSDYPGGCSRQARPAPPGRRRKIGTVIFTSHLG